MWMALAALRRPSSLLFLLLLLLLLLLLFTSLMLLLPLLLMGVSMGSPPPPIAPPKQRTGLDYAEISAKVLKESPCRGVSPGHLLSWQPAFIVVVTANPSTTDVHSFAFLRCCLDNKFILQKEQFDSVHQSIVSYARNVTKLRSLLIPLLDSATDFVPKRFRKFAPVLFRATSDLRSFLSRKGATRLMFKVKSILRSSPFKVKSDQITIMDKTDEAADLWLSAAFLTGRLYTANSNPLAVADLAGGTLRVAVPLSKSPTRVSSEGVVEEDVEKKRSKRFGRSGGEFAPMEEDVGVTFRGDGGSEWIGAGKGYYESPSSSHDEIHSKASADFRITEGQKSPTPSMPLLGLSQKTQSSSAGSSEIPYGVSPTRASYRLPKNFNNTSKFDTFFQSYLKTFFLNPREKTSNGLTSEYRSPNGSFLLGVSEEEGVNSNNTTKLWRHLEFKSSVKRHAAKDRSRHKFDRRKGKRRFIAKKKKKKKKRKRNTKLPIEFKNGVGLYGLENNFTSFIKNWCKNSSWNQNTDNVNITRSIPSHLKDILEAYCLLTNLVRDSSVESAENSPNAYGKQSEQMMIAPKFPNLEVNTQIQGRNMHRKMERRRVEGHLISADIISMQEKEVDVNFDGGSKREKSELKAKVEVREGENGNINKGEDLKNNAGNDRKQNGCNEIKGRERRSYCQTNSAIFNERPFSIERENGVGRASKDSFKMRRKRNKSLSKLYFKRKRRKYKSENVFQHVRHILREDFEKQSRNQKKEIQSMNQDLTHITSIPVKYLNDYSRLPLESNHVKRNVKSFNPASNRQPLQSLRSNAKEKVAFEKAKPLEMEPRPLSNQHNDDTNEPFSQLLNFPSTKSSLKSVAAETVTRNRRNARKYLPLSSNITFRCSPSKKFRLYATSFPLGIYPARVSVLLGGNSTSSFGVPSNTSSPTPPPFSPTPPTKRRSDIHPEQEYKFDVNDFATFASSPPPSSQLPTNQSLLSSSLTPSSRLPSVHPPRSSLTPTPEPSGPGPPSQDPLDTHPYPKVTETHPSPDSINTDHIKIFDVGFNEAEKDREITEDPSWSNSSLIRPVWTVDTLEKVKTVVDSVLRAIGSARRVSDKQPKRTKPKDPNSPIKEVSGSKDQSRRKKISEGRKGKRNRFAKRKRKKMSGHSLNHEAGIQNGSLARKTPSQKYTKKIDSTDSIPINENSSSATHHRRDPKPVVSKAGAISSVTDLLFTVPNVRVIKPVENSRVDSAIKSTEKLVLTSLTDLLFSVPSRPYTNASINSSRPDTHTANFKAFPTKGHHGELDSLSPPEPLTKASDELTIRSSCIPFGSMGKFTLNDLTYLVIGKNIRNRSEDCANEVSKIVEKYVNVPSMERIDFLGTRVFYFVAVSADLIDPNDSSGYVSPLQFQEAADQMCSRPAEHLPDPLVCLDYQFVAALLTKGFNLPLNQQIMVCDYLGEFGLSSALGAALNYLQGH